MLSVLFVTVLTSGFLSRPSQAEIFDSAGCLLNITSCEQADPTAPAKPADPSDVTTPGDTPDPGTGTGTGESGGGDQTTPPDAEPPVVKLNVDPLLAGGTSQTVNIQAFVQDGNLASYSLAVNGIVAQQGSAFDDPSAPISFTVPWSVSTPNVVPSGMYTITLDAADAAGNPSHTEVTVEVDNDAPVTTIKKGGLIQSGSISPDVSADDPHGIASYAWTASSDNPAKLTFDPSVAEPTFTPTVEGSYVFTVAVADGLGNVGTQQFTFDYAPVLATIPLPVVTDPTQSIAPQSPTPTVDSVATPSIRSTDVATTNDAAVLGNTITAPGQIAPATSASALTPTGRGWSIFGVLWYWWVIAIVVILASWMAIKKFTGLPLPEHS